jgi:hypothetical protein
MTYSSIGDIAVIWNTGDRRLIIDRRDEIVPVSDRQFSSQYQMRTVYRLAGSEYTNRWFDNSEISSVIPRNVS